MKKHLVIFLLAVSLLFNVFFVAGYVRATRQAESAEGVRPANHDEPDAVAVIADRVAKELGLDEAQREVFMQLQRELREDEQVHRESLALVRQELIEALQDEKIEPSMAREIMQREASLHQELKLMAAQRFGQFMATLTHEQREKLQERLRMHRPRGGGERRPLPPEVIAKFDANQDGVLDEAERREWLKTMPGRRGGGEGSGWRDGGRGPEGAEGGWMPRERGDGPGFGDGPDGRPMREFREGGEGGGRPGGEMLEWRVRAEVVRRFDEDRDGQLNEAERRALVDWLMRPPDGRRGGPTNNGMRGQRLGEQGIVLAPGAIHEACFEASDSMRVVYWYRATSEVGFNIHYHEGEEIGYPVLIEASASERGELRIAFAQTYCLMWTNTGSEAVTLDFGARVDSSSSVDGSDR